MTCKKALKVLEMFLYKQCSLSRTAFAYDDNTVWGAVNMATEALETIDSLKDQITLLKRSVKSENSDYLTGYTCALSAVEGVIAEVNNE